MRSLRALAERESQFLTDFRQSGPATLMIRLVHTEFLLELAKLTNLGLDMASYAEHVVEVIDQFLPVRNCALSFEVEGLPPTRAERGLIEGASDDNLGPLSAEVAIGSNGTAMIEVCFESAEIGPPEFLEAIAEQLSNGMSAIAETERLRRQAALVEIANLVSSLRDDPSVGTLQETVEAFSYLPNVVGVSVEVTHSVLDGPVTLHAGLSGRGDWTTIAADGGFVRLRVAWAASAQDVDRQVVFDAVSQIASALDKADDRRRLAYEAETDQLTGIANRRRGMQALEMSVGLAGINDDSLTVAYFDLDKFKQLNDRHGHQAGDDVLTRFAAHVRSSVRRSDTVARVGGEEFMLICPGIDYQSGRRLLETIVRNTSEACRTAAAPDWDQTTSAGIAVFPSDGTTPLQLMRAADLAMYTVKRDGGNNVGPYAPR